MTHGLAASAGSAGPTQRGSDELLPYLTTRAEMVLTEASDALLGWTGDHLPGADPTALAFAADTIVRLVVSHIVLPGAPIEQTATALANLAVHLFTTARPSH
ncbi:hypothetical protein [Micromonospora sp. NPDC049102]|uniref:hypothetical protein n=1 Tax=Micromonospora sp. NPDC049102 TaxID=3364265 RepID=UPI0037240AA7